MTVQSYVISAEYDRCRIDKSLSLITGKSRSYIQTLIAHQNVQCNASLVMKADAKVTVGDVITLTEIVPKPLTIQPADIPLDIVFEDENLFIINKPAGMVVHPAPGNYEGTLVHAVLGYCQSVQDVGEVDRPGIVHRLDKDTSGLIIVAKTALAHEILSRQFQPICDGQPEKEKAINRIYYGLVWGTPPAKGVISTKIARHYRDRQRMCALDINSQARRGKIAVTHYHVEKTWKLPQKNSAISLLRFQLLTGRTHQIRVHCQFIKHPLVGDPVYGKKSTKDDQLWPAIITAFPHQALHAKEISFDHPITHIPLSFNVPFPDDIQELIEILDKAMHSAKDLQ